MPELKCTVQTCLHNQNYYCDLDNIKVGGSSAKHAQDTCCDSFEERKDGNSYSNTMKEASPLFNNIAYYALTPQKYSYYFIFRLLLQLLVLLCQQSLSEYLQ